MCLNLKFVQLFFDARMCLRQKCKSKQQARKLLHTIVSFANFNFNWLNNSNIITTTKLKIFSLSKKIMLKKSSLLFRNHFLFSTKKQRGKNVNVFAAKRKKECHRIKNIILLIIILLYLSNFFY